MELMGDEAVSVWKKFVGPAEQREALQSAGDQLGADGLRNVGHGSDSLVAAARVRKQVTHQGPRRRQRLLDCFKLQLIYIYV